MLKQENKKVSLSELYESYSQDIFRYSFSILKSVDDARDAMQDVFVRYAENENTFRGQCSYKTWLLIIARNYCLNKLKSRKMYIEEIDYESPALMHVEDYDETISVGDALATLPPGLSELIYLVDFEGYSYKEISEITSQSLENVKIKIFRARKKLREILK